jgi:hypothetical protein
MQKAKLSKSLNCLLISLSSALLFSAPSVANNTASPALTNVEQTLTENVNRFTEAEIEQMLAPIALYPDALLSHILIASTYPIEVVDAERWLSKNSQLSPENIADAAESKDWDASVKALLPFHNILKKLSEDLRWMSNLGDAFLQDEAQVLASVQALRQQADQAGNLQNMNNVNVVRETKTIIIESSQPDVIYVPYYDTRLVYGDWRWRHYPPIYWHQPVHYVSHHGHYYWHNPVHLSVGLFFGAVHWHNRHVVVNHHKSRYYKRHSKKKVSTSYQAKRWQHNPRHRKGVAYRSTKLQKKYRSLTPSVQHHKAVRANQKHLFNKNKHITKQVNNKYKPEYNTGRSDKIKQKLQVNRAIKVDKKNASIKHQPYAGKNWHKSKVDSKQVKKVRKVESAKSSKKYYASKHQAVKSSHKQVKSRQSEKVISHRKSSEQNYAKPISTTKKSYQPRHSAKSERTISKRSFENKQRSRNNSSHRSKSKREN